MSINRALIFLSCLATIHLQSFSQDLNKKEPLVVESWKEGNQQIHETDFEFQLSCTPSEKEFWKKVDSTGGDAYVFRVHPAAADKCDEEGSFGWVVTLYEEGSEEPLDGLLHPTNDPYQDYFTEKDFPGFFHLVLIPEEQREIPMLRKRIVKVEDFYVVMQAEDIVRAESGFITSMLIHVCFFNDLNNAACPLE